ncbi:MAG: M48 family peptidase [Nitrososphaera sp.]|jgi:hypothetical protein
MSQNNQYKVEEKATSTEITTSRSAQVPQTSEVSGSAEKASAALSRIVQLFSTTELHKTVATVYIQTAGRPCESWSIGNLLLMYLAGTNDGRTYAAWKGVGRNVKKGAKAFYILEPRYITKVRTDPQSGEPVLHEGKPVTYQVLAGFRPSPRFRYEDTEGEPLQEYRPRQLPPLMNVAEKWGVKVSYANTRMGEQGYFEPATNSIVLCVEDPSVFFHELAHKAHGKIEELKPGQDKEQETVAELAACTLSDMYGYDVKGNSYEYIAHYARGHSPEQVGRLCMKVLDKVKKVLDLILRADDENKEEDELKKEKEASAACGQNEQGQQQQQPHSLPNQRLDTDAVMMEATA